MSLPPPWECPLCGLPHRIATCIDWKDIEMAEPQRREQRRTHLDASVVPVERALLARATQLSRSARVEELTADLPSETNRVIYGEMAREFRDLAEELHWW